MTRNNELGSKRFIELPTWLAIPAAGFGAVTFEVFHHFGLASAGRVAAFFAFALFGVIAKCRPLWRKPWLWFFFLGSTIIHAAVIMLVRWPDPHYSALLIAPFAVADFFVSLKLIELIDTHLTS